MHTLDETRGALSREVNFAVTELLWNMMWYGMLHYIVYDWYIIYIYIGKSLKKCLLRHLILFSDYTTTNTLGVWELEKL